MEQMSNLHVIKTLYTHPPYTACTGTNDLNGQIQLTAYSIFNSELPEHM